MSQNTQIEYFDSDVDVVDGFYGVIVTTKDQESFVRKGKAVYVDYVFENIEDGTVSADLTFEFNGRDKTINRQLGEIYDINKFQELVAQGIDTDRRSAPVLIETLRLQVEEIEQNVKVRKAYASPGWYVITSPDGSPKRIYRSFRALSDSRIRSKYVGTYNLQHKGSYLDYLDMLKTEVIGHTAIEYAFLLGLSAILVGLIGVEANIENPIVHIFGDSGTGKSTVGKLVASAFGCPFDSPDNDGIGFKSLYGSWGATAKAMLTKCDGNYGAAMVFNELGKTRVSDLTTFVYDISEGTDIERLEKTTALKYKPPFRTAFISTGEISLIDKCASKVDGLEIRVLELNMPMTDNAEHADRIAAVVHESYGFIAPMIAHHILRHSSKDAVLETFNRWKAELIPVFPKAAQRERFVSKFAALVLATAEITEAAIEGLSFEKDALIEFALSRYKEKVTDLSVVKKNAYETILEACRINSNYFIEERVGEGRHEPTNGKIFGRIKHLHTRFDDNRVILEEYEIRPAFLKETLEKSGFSPKTCIKAWKDDGLLDYENDRDTRSRKLTSSRSPENVYVLRVFGSVDDLVCETPPQKLSSRRVSIWDEGEEEATC